jgi:hypothetical protein
LILTIHSLDIVQFVGLTFGPQECWEGAGFLQPQAPRSGLHFTIAIAIALDVSPVTIVVAVQSVHHEGACPYIGHLFVDILPKVSYIKYASAVFKVSVQEVCPKVFKYG